jgi:pimeloyl-ACP methyl ester carboxylesterase
MTAWTAEHVALIRSQLQRVTAGSAFAASGRMPALLRHLVEAEMDGGARRLSQMSIAMDVFGRPGDFDPAVDSIVRVEMGRLRNKLREYYTTEGKGDPVTFEVPKGRYTIAIEVKAASGGRQSQVPNQELRFCQAKDGTTIAYATSGNGYPLVKVANWLSHLEYDYQSPIWRHWWGGLAERFRLIRYDERGCGLSDWNVADISFDAWVDDLEEVANTTAPGKFALFGMSQGVPVAVAYAARYPERVSHLILYGGPLRGALTLGDPSIDERVKLLRQLLKLGWAEPSHAFSRVFASLFVPQGSEEQFKWFDDLQRVCTSADNAVRFWDVCCTLDVSAIAQQVRTPALVLHVEQDSVVPFEEARFTASRIPGARLVPLQSNNHILLENEPAFSKLLEEVSEFIGRGERRQTAGGRREADRAR